jgi:hypothetical protein
MGCKGINFRRSSILFLCSNIRFRLFNSRPGWMRLGIVTLMKTNQYACNAEFILSLTLDADVGSVVQYIQ